MDLSCKRPATHKGIFYFPEFSVARQWAERRGFPTNRIIAYTRGWAIQLYVSGPYVGPETIIPLNALEIALELGSIKESVS